MKAQSRTYLGIHEGHHAAVCRIRETGKAGTETEIFLKERITRVKHDRGSVHEILKDLANDLSDNRKPGSTLLGHCVWNRELRDRLPPALAHNITHHYAHAMASVANSPFRKSLVLVFDGAGSSTSAFEPDHPEIRDFPPPVPDEISESLTVYLQDDFRLRCVHKEWQAVPPLPLEAPVIGMGLGNVYETVSFHIFNKYNQAGKAMGLAPFGKATPVSNRQKLLDDLDRAKAFQGHSKKDWESSDKFSYFADLAATLQAHFETSLLALLESLHRRFPERENLILMGGCALNCSANTKVARTGWFKRIYVPPFPSDESIAFGVASHLRYAVTGRPWKPVSWSNQTGNFGPARSRPEAHDIPMLFQGFKIAKPRSIAEECASLLGQGKIVGWYQGRSESGPRALGFRSILADPTKTGIKDELNSRIKHREAFRPYGCSVSHGKAHLYFDVPRGFESPFMAFAPSVRAQFASPLRELVHRDGSCRIQTVRASQSPLFHELISLFGGKMGIHCVLNTSMNVMGEPIVETPEDARRWFQGSGADALVIGKFLVQNS